MLPEANSIHWLLVTFSGAFALLAAFFVLSPFFPNQKDLFWIQPQKNIKASMIKETVVFKFSKTWSSISALKNLLKLTTKR